MMITVGRQVHVASRMESSSQPEMIQMSEPAHDLMRANYSEFNTTLRGTVEVKVRYSSVYIIQLKNYRVWAR